MKLIAITLSLFLLGSLKAQGNNAPVVQDEPTVFVPDHTLDLTTSFLNTVYENPNVKVGSPIQLYKEVSGDYIIQASKPDEGSLMVTIFTRGTDGAKKKVFLQNKYNWVKDFHTLVAIECEEVIEHVPTIVKDVCTTAVQTASKVLQVIVNAGFKPEEANLPVVAECIKTRLIETTNEETQECFLEVIQKGTEDVSQAVALKVAQLEAQGYVCDANNDCVKKIEGEDIQQEQVLEKKEVEGDVRKK